MEEEQEDQELGVKQWVNHDETPEDGNLDEYIHDTMPEAPERERLLLTLKLPKLFDYEEMVGAMRYLQRMKPTRNKRMK